MAADKNNFSLDLKAVNTFLMILISIIGSLIYREMSAIDDFRKTTTVRLNTIEQQQARSDERSKAIEAKIDRIIVKLDQDK